MSKKNYLVISFIILSLILSACGGLGTPKTVKVAVSMPLGLDVGKSMLNAAQLALNNAGGKAGNVTVQIVSYDISDPSGSPMSADLEAKNAKTAVQDAMVVGYIGPASSSGAKGSVPILNQASIAQITPSATWPGLTKPGYGPGEPGIYYPSGKQTLFRTVPSDELQSAAAARWCTQLGFKKAFIAIGDDAYGNGLAGIFEITAGDEGIDILDKASYQADVKLTTDDLKALAIRALTGNPDVIYIAGSNGTNGLEVLQAIRQIDSTIPVMVPDGLAQDDVITTLGANLTNNIYGTTITLPVDKLNTPGAEAFLKSYQAAYGKEPSAYEAATYEAMSVMLYAIGKAKEPTREGVLESMQNLGDYSGIFGTWSFDQQGDISVAGISGLQIKNDAWVFVQALK
jgi:branched-chain amino acid transport system substrate-binding protein